MRQLARAALHVEAGRQWSSEGAPSGAGCPPVLNRPGPGALWVRPFFSDFGL